MLHNQYLPRDGSENQSSHRLLRQAADVADEATEGVARLVDSSRDPRVALESLRASQHTQAVSTK